MKTRILKTLGTSALLVGIAAAGIASASARDASDGRAAAAGAAKANKALSRHDGRQAVDEAEHAVALAPRDAGYRLLLGQSYLAAGRFPSARTALADALALAPTNGKAALSLALAEIATGDWSAARRTLDEHGAGIAPADRGLALALAGDPVGAVRQLTEVARSAQTSPKVRQNLALALALAGEWPAARAVAAVDVAPASLDARLEQWAAFAHPRAAADQVASLLGVTPIEDSGQPLRLALGDERGVVVAAVAAPVPPVAPAPPAAAADPRPAEPIAIPAQVAAAAPSAAPAPAPVKAIAPVGRVDKRVVTSRPVVAKARAPMPPAQPGPAKAMLAAATSRGNWFVQLGAFGSSAVARDAWTRAAHRMPALTSRGPSGASFTAHKVSVYRLSVGGFARPQANALCQRYRATGGACFVRVGAGDQIAAWVRKGAQLAAR